MSDAKKDLERAATYAPDDVLAILFRHHAHVRESLDRVKTATGQYRELAFASLTTLLTAHESAEQKVIRPVTAELAGADVVDERNREEAEADEVIHRLARLDPMSRDFDEQFTRFMKAVSAHAEAEEDEEFRALEQGCDEGRRKDLGAEFLTAFHAAGGAS